MTLPSILNFPPFNGDSHVEWFEGNFEAYEEGKRRRLGPEADRPHRMSYKKLTR